jgi:hypothetical protein
MRARTPNPAIFPQFSSEEAMLREGPQGGGGGAYDVWSRLGTPADDDPTHAPGPSWATASCSDIIKLVQEVRNMGMWCARFVCWSIVLVCAVEVRYVFRTCVRVE